VVTRGQRLVLRDLLQRAHDEIARLNDECEALRIDLAAAYCPVEPDQQLWLDLFAGLGLPVHSHVWWVPEDLDTHVEWIATYTTGGRRIP